MSSPIKIMRVRVPAEDCATATVEWQTLNVAGQAVNRGNCHLSELHSSADMELVIPASMVAVHTLELPAVAAKHEMAILRQQLEDRVLGGMEDCHLVRGERHGNSQMVWLVSRQWMLKLLDTCRTAQIAPTRIIPEQALLPSQSFAKVEGGIVFRTSTGNYGTLPDETLLQAVCGESLVCVENLLIAPLAARLDLMQGLPALRQIPALSRPQLKTAGCLILAIAGIYLFSQILEWRQLASQETRLHETIRQNFAAAHPGVPIIDPILQWRQLHGKQNGGAGGDILDQVTQFAVMTALPIHPQRLDAEGNTIKITLGTSDATQLKPVLKDKNIKFDTLTTDTGLEQIIITRNSGKGQS
jgi:general secretion pathway protein L